MEQFSFKQDLNILIRTISKALKADDFHDGNVAIYSSRNNMGESNEKKVKDNINEKKHKYVEKKIADLYDIIIWWTF